MQKSQGICSISFPLEENGRGPGVTPTPEVMAAERSPRAASMSTTQPLIKTGSYAFEIFMRCGSKNFKHGLENNPENSPGYYRTNAHGSPTKILLEKRGIRKEPENPVKKNLKKDEKGMLS